MNQIKDLKAIITGIFKVLGWSIIDLIINYEPDLELNPERMHNVQISTNHGLFYFDLVCESRPFTTSTLLGDRTVVRDEWVVSTIVQKDGGYWDPPYEDTLELASDPGLGKALIDALLSEVRTQMYDSLPYTPDIRPLDIELEEDVPQ